MSIIDRLQRQHLKALTPYASARREAQRGSCWLNANESPFAPSVEGAETQLNRYPDFQSLTLNQQFADYCGVQPQQLLSCRGADEGIDLLLRAFCEPGIDRIVITSPTYGMYQIAAQSYAVEVVDVPLQGPQWQPDCDAVIAAAKSAKLVFLCQPSNPLGAAIEAEVLEHLIRECDNTMVVVDEAYFEFSDQQSATNWLQKYPNLVVLRTLSKAFALAGARCGFVVGSAELIGLLSKILAPYPLPVSSLRQAQQVTAPAAITAMQQRVSLLLQQRQRLQQWFSQQPGFALLSASETNFLLVAHRQSATIQQYLAERGIVVRNQSKQPGLPACLRFTVGSADENTQLLAALAAYQNSDQCMGEAQ